MFLFNARHIINGSSPRAAQVLRSVVQQSFLFARWPWCIYFNIFSDQGTASGYGKKQIEKSSWLLFILLLFQLKNSLLILSFPKIVHAESSSSLLLCACLSQYGAWFLLPNKLWPQVFFSFQSENGLGKRTASYLSYSRPKWITDSHLQVCLAWILIVAGLVF